MYDDLALRIPIGEINKRLTRNARERDRLRTMLRVAVEAGEDAGKSCPAIPVDALQPKDTRQEVVH
jgi:hypothetical protein